MFFNFDIHVKSNSVTNYIENDISGRRISHCYANCIVRENGHAIANVVLDKYTPKNAQHGWYVAIRRPGRTERQTPPVRIFVAEDLVSVLLRNAGDLNVAKLLIDTWIYHKEEFMSIIND